MKKFEIDSIVIHPEVAGTPVVEDIISKNPGIKIREVPPETLYKEINNSYDPQSEGKKHLLLTRQKGEFLRRCPGTRRYRCCGYQILHVGTYCTMDCSYCILQVYFHPPVLTFFVNLEDMERALESRLHSNAFRRIGTGEFTDSLIWEPVYPIAQRLVKIFAQSTNAVLELKTKTAYIDHLLRLSHAKKTIISWSVNTPRVVDSEERLTASIHDRIHAASKAAHHGYPVGFHFDPMVIYPGCEEEYRKVVDMIFRLIPAELIAWISLGAFRFIADLKSVISRRFPGSNICANEFVCGKDDKMRYFKPLRVRLYRAVADRIKEHSPETCVYFCMEDDAVWNAVFGFTPTDKGGLPSMLDAAARRVTGIH